MENLRPFRWSENPQALQWSGEGEASRNRLKLSIFCTREFLEDAIEGLYRMNINRATLFPGLDGFAKHLEALIAMPKAIAWNPAYTLEEDDE